MSLENTPVPGSGPILLPQQSLIDFNEASEHSTNRTDFKSSNDNGSDPQNIPDDLTYEEIGSVKHPTEVVKGQNQPTLNEVSSSKYFLAGGCTISVKRSCVESSVSTSLPTLFSALTPTVSILESKDDASPENKASVESSSPVSLSTSCTRLTLNNSTNEDLSVSSATCSVSDLCIPSNRVGEETSAVSGIIASSLFPGSRRVIAKFQESPAFRCQICGTPFTRKGNMKRHLMSAHGQLLNDH